jgi:1-acyl-sn-glycerol-3-phosphate acyltransferase
MKLILSLLRVLYRAPIAMLLTEFMYHYGLVRSWIVPKWRGKRFTDVIGAWGAMLAWSMGVRIVRRNQRSRTMGDVIIANHMGFLDVPVLLALYPSVFIIKDEMRRVPHFGAALKHMGHVFVDRKSDDSRKSARAGVQRVLEDGDRIIVFPEGRATPGTDRPPFKPFCFFEAERQKKSVELCVIDYLPDREQLKWDVNRGMFPQLVELFGRWRTHISVEFHEPEIPADPEALARKYHDIVEQKLRQHDAERERKPLA